MTVYDKGIRFNEWFVIIGMCIGTLAVIFLPRRFLKQYATVYFMLGVFFGLFFDHVLQDFYDISDRSTAEVMDFLTCLMYGPYSYLYFYILDYFRITKSLCPLYILAWSLISLVMEWGAIVFGVFHYRNGYHLGYSFGVYLLVFSVWSMLYYRYDNEKDFVS